MNCGEGGHPVGKCPVLRTPLKDGFYSGGGGGGGGHSHDDDERVQKGDGAVAPDTRVARHNERRMCYMFNANYWGCGSRYPRM